MQVEVCVQDCFETDETIDDEINRPTAIAAFSQALAVETWEVWFQTWLEVLQPDLSSLDAYELSLRLTDDAEIQSLNHQYRQQNQPTDVLAFAALEAIGPPLDEMESLLPLYLGDIIISVDTAERQAQAQGHPLKVELAWLAAHGLLHLLGWDHPDDDSLLRMLDQQQVLLDTVGLAIETR